MPGLADLQFVLLGLPVTAVSLTNQVVMANLFYFFILVCYYHSFLELAPTSHHSV